MKLSVQFPLHTKSENELRSLPFVVANVAKTKGGARAMGVAHSIANRAKKQRREVRMVLDSQLPRLRRQLTVLCAEQAATVDNTFRVTMIRISAGVLDDDGLAGALKHVQDEIAAWLGIDDGPRAPVRWQRAQQKGPAKVYAVRIEIEDDDPDPREVRRIVGPPIAMLGPVIGDVQHALSAYATAKGKALLLTSSTNAAWPSGKRPHPLDEHLLESDRMHAPAPRVRRRSWDPRKPLEQAPLIFRRSYYAPPGQDEDADEVSLEELIGPLFEVEQPPPRIIKGGRMLQRRQDFHPALGEHWIYEAAPGAARPSQREERAEARR